MSEIKIHFVEDKVKLILAIFENRKVSGPDLVPVLHLSICGNNL